jgi:hypothetical protein
MEDHRLLTAFDDSAACSWAAQAEQRGLAIELWIMTSRAIVSIAMSRKSVCCLMESQEEFLTSTKQNFPV